ncbi:hypothetical protein D3C77_401120 [compost metagenome]
MTARMISSSEQGRKTTSSSSSALKAGDSTFRTCRDTAGIAKSCLLFHLNQFVHRRTYCGRLGMGARAWLARAQSDPRHRIGVPHRAPQTGAFTAHEWSHERPEMNFIELISRHAEQVFSTKAKAEAWLNKPAAAFGGITPLECALSESGYIQVRASLERIHHGYSC